MEDLIKAIETTPIIDHHAHNLLIPSELNAYDLLSITSEARGPALKQGAPSTLSHLRAVHQLSELLGCEPNWDAVQIALKQKREEPDDTWAKQCFQGIETVLIDDGLDPSNVHDYKWHDRLVRSKCRRIVRIETIIENILLNAFGEVINSPSGQAGGSPTAIVAKFRAAIEAALEDPEVAGFKSVICYRTGLAIPGIGAQLGAGVRDAIRDLLVSKDKGRASRLEDNQLSPFFVHLTALTIQESKIKKPFQFHTGLGDNDINLELSNPAHLQTFIEAYPSVPIVLLHASYPFTTEAGYLASVYSNVWLDIGEVFPFLSQDGQERVVREALDLCPSGKLTWSTDGHWFPETYLLATMQMREAMQQVLCEYVSRGALTAEEAIMVTQDIFFETSNKLYQLKLPINTAPTTIPLSLSSQSSDAAWVTNFAHFQRFIQKNPSIQYLRLQWLDYTATLRLRVLPIKEALNMFRAKKFIKITKAVLGLLQNDGISPGFLPVGVLLLYPQFESLRLASRPGYATLQCEFQRDNATELPYCPRTALRKQVEKANTHGLNLLVGFEIEVVFMSSSTVDGDIQYGAKPINDGGQAWSTARALHQENIMALIERIHHDLERAGVVLQQFHPESSPGQYEFVLGPLPPLQAVDALLAAREIISTAAANHGDGLRATLYPKPSTTHAGTGAHVHVSLNPDNHWQSFYAGILEHLQTIAAFTYANNASYERVTDGAWAGSTWIAWGTENREAPLRRIEGSHFEIKCMDGLSNPYLALAALLGAGIQGLLDKKKLRMTDCPHDPSTLSETARDGYSIQQQFPKSIDEALKHLADNTWIRGILGYEVVQVYINVKRAEDELLKQMDKNERRNWLIERY